MAWWKGLSVGWVWRFATLFNIFSSTVLLSLPFCLVATTILLHHYDGVPMGTFSSSPRVTSLSKVLLTSGWKWTGTVQACGLLLVFLLGPHRALVKENHSPLAMDNAHNG